MTEENHNTPVNEENGASSAPTKPRKSPSPKRPTPRNLPPWKVLLHNDDVNDMDKVISVIRQLTSLSKQEAEQRAVEAHRTGVALLLVTHQERAELHVEQFATFDLTVTAEPDV